MTKNIEKCEEITFNEFRAWMTGLIRGKRGALPDLEDWKQIKIMMDKVEESRKTVDFPLQPTYAPTIFRDPPPFQPVEQPWYNPNQIWCTSTSTDGINFGDLDVEIPTLSEPSIGNIEAFNVFGEPRSKEEFDKEVEDFEKAVSEMIVAQEEKNGS